METKLETNLEQWCTARCVEVTPHIASAWLSTSLGNRVIKRKVVDKYGKEMANKAWKRTGEVICFSASGVLLNGHHRLQACVKAQTNFDVLVVFGISDDAYSAMDSGLKRSSSDFLRHNGVVNATTTAACVRMVVQLSNGARSTKSSNQYLSLNNDEILAEAKDPVYVTAFPLAALARRCGFTDTQVVTFGVLALRAGVYWPSLWNFMSGVGTGESLPKGDPRLALRNWALNNKDRKRKIENAVQVATLVRTFNAWQESSSLATIKPWSADLPFPQFSTSNPNKEQS